MAAEKKAKLPLEGIKVLDISRVLTGPFCTMILGDLGAEVIKVEMPGVGDETRSWGPPFVNGESAYFLSVNRNKKSITVNMKSPKGREIIYRLAKEADVMIENFLPGTVQRLGVDYERIKEINPQIIYCSLSGYGQDGPYRDHPAYDLLMQGEGGLMSITGEKDGEPVRIGVAIIDIGAGMYAVIGILSALMARKETGKGQYIDISLLDTEVSWLTYMASNYFASGKDPIRMGSGHPSIVPYRAFRARDKYFILAVGNDAIWQRFCAALGLEFVDDPRFMTNEMRVKHRDELEKLLAEIFIQKEASYWVNLLHEHKVPCGMINAISEVVSHPQVLHRGMVVEMDHEKAGKVKVLGSPLNFSGMSIEYRLPPPLLGQHTSEILSSLGYTAAEIEELKACGAI
ncbi:CaiB/BaiF CoA transferase family protein [Desulfofundulus thermosubterraneus]|uniref:Formyl-CoA transferase n=1 Tax=Desulfofundulus thermosubterraneus DSM 16057 TaxID=1121432 RepID=A0A1M6A4X7_9FIRM|nr:CaiB/BaiF CoA-transferase family protein [Desulfofundulus thermosubterraneus]SHI31518.1 formyl-CoA transferase [Desulfofundulus thermosubterraneus DSM 16057]